MQGHPCALAQAEGMIDAITGVSLRSAEGAASLRDLAAGKREDSPSEHDCWRTTCRHSCAKRQQTPGATRLCSRHRENCTGCWQRPSRGGRSPFTSERGSATIRIGSEVRDSCRISSTLRLSLWLLLPGRGFQEASSQGWHLTLARRVAFHTLLLRSKRGPGKCPCHVNALRPMP